MTGGITHRNIHSIWAPVITSLSFFERPPGGRVLSFIVFFLCFIFCWKVERQIGCARHGPWTRIEDKKGTTVPNRLSRLQHQFKIGTQPAAGAARCRRSPLQAPGVWGWNPHNRHLTRQVLGGTDDETTQEAAGALPRCGGAGNDGREG